MKSAKLITAVIVFALSVSCNKREQSREESSLVAAYKMIDAQRTDEAIQLLEAELATLDPASPYYSKVKVALGSAYAHKAGIKVQKFSKLLKVGKIDTKFKDARKTDTKKKPTRAESADLYLKSVARMITGISNVAGAYTAIPNIKPEDEKYLIYSLKILDSVKIEQLTQGDALYRAVIRIIYLKHYMSSRVFEDATAVDIDSKTCEVNFDKISNTLHKLAGTGILIFDDLAHSAPKKAKKYKESRDDLLQAASDLTIISTFASVIDDATLALSKQALVETGLRKLLKCAKENPGQQPPPSAPSASL
jgi:hypothetical protein